MYGLGWEDRAGSEDGGTGTSVLTALWCWGYTLPGSCRLRGNGDGGATGSQCMSLLKAGAIVLEGAFAKDWHRRC